MESARVRVQHRTVDQVGFIWLNKFVCYTVYLSMCEMKARAESVRNLGNASPYGVCWYYIVYQGMLDIYFPTKLSANK